MYAMMKCDIKPAIKTDHSLITLSLSINKDAKRGAGLWKFNNSLLSDLDYVGYMKGIIELKKFEYIEVVDPVLKWELIKMSIRDATTVYSKTQANLRREYENNLQYQFIKLSSKNDCYENEVTLLELTKVKQLLEEINSLKTEGIKVRAKAMDVEYNEKSSNYFLNIEQ